MDMNPIGSAATPAERPTRESGFRSWMLALALGAVLAVGGAASVFAASPTADASASPAATSSEDAGGTTDDSTDRVDCPEHDSDSSDSDASSS